MNRARHRQVSKLRGAGAAGNLAGRTAGLEADVIGRGCGLNTWPGLWIMAAAAITQAFFEKGVRRGHRSPAAGTPATGRPLPSQSCSSGRAGLARGRPGWISPRQPSRRP